MLGDFGETVVIDWGVAKDLDAEEALPPLQDDISTPGIPSSTSGSLTLAGDVLGTAHEIAISRREAA